MVLNSKGSFGLALNGPVYETTESVVGRALFQVVLVQGCCHVRNCSEYDEKCKLD